MADFLTLDSTELKSNESFEKTIALNVATDDFKIKETKEYGEYKIVAKYQNIISNEATFTLTYPKGIDKQLYEATYQTLFNSNLNKTEKFTKLENLLQEFPNSKYSPQLYGILFIEKIADEVNDEFFNNNFDRFFQYNNDKYGSGFILRSYGLYLSRLNLDSSQFQSKINTLIAKYPNSKLEKIVNFKLEERNFIKNKFKLS